MAILIYHVNFYSFMKKKISYTNMLTTCYEMTMCYFQRVITEQFYLQITPSIFGVVEIKPNIQCITRCVVFSCHKIILITLPNNVTKPRTRQQIIRLRAFYTCYQTQFNQCTTFNFVQDITVSVHRLDDKILDSSHFC